MNRPTLMQRINRRLDAQRNGERGLALLDVLLGMAIFALIAVIAVQSMGKFRERAHVTQMVSDLQQVRVATAAAMTESNSTAWDAAPATAKNATRDTAWWTLLWNTSNIPVTFRLSTADLQRLGINLTNPATTSVTVFPRYHLIEGLLSAVTMEATPGPGAQDTLSICIYDSATGVFARSADGFTYNSGSTPATMPAVYVTGKHTGAGSPCTGM